MIGTVDEVVIDCADPAVVARFWADVLGGTPTERDPAWWYIRPPGWTQLSFQRVPERKSGKNRLHIDVLVDDLAAATEQAERLGARRSGPVRVSPGGSFQVLTDPEGNEWCVVRPGAPAGPPGS